MYSTKSQFKFDTYYLLLISGSCVAKFCLLVCIGQCSFLEHFNMTMVYGTDEKRTTNKLVTVCVFAKLKKNSSFNGNISIKIKLVLRFAMLIETCCLIFPLLFLNLETGTF